MNKHSDLSRETRFRIESRLEDIRFMRLTIGISEDIKSKIINDFTYEQMLEVQSDLNEWKWNNLLGEAPEGFDTLSVYEVKWYKDTLLYRKLFKNRTKSDYTSPIREFVECFLTKRDMIYYRDVIKYKNMTEEEFEKFWIQYCFSERVSIAINITL